MPVKRDTFDTQTHRFFSQFDRWQPDREGFTNIYRDALPEAEFALKRKRFSRLIAASGQRAQVALDTTADWDLLVRETNAKMVEASLYHLFTGDRDALTWAQEALTAMEQCERPHFCYSVLIGQVDIDLRTAGVMRALATMRSCFAGALDPSTTRRLEAVALTRCLEPALDALRKRTYWWTTCRMNWRSVITGSFAMGAMAFADRFNAWREMVEYGVEGILAVLDAGGRDGGWQEGPGYWEYGMSHCAEPAFALKVFTGGAVDLFEHPYLKQTGTFSVYMTTRPGHVWNWSDGPKLWGKQQTLAILARVYGNAVYQHFAREGTITTLTQAFYMDPSLRPAPPQDWPLTKLFGDIGVAVMRTGFGRHDVFVGVKAGAMGDGVDHEHADLGSLVIHAAGKELLAELDPWTYAQATGKAGGFFERTGRRWDYDGNAPIGHSLVMLEGKYPPFDRTVRATLGHAACGRDADLITVDASAMHEPLGQVVKRYIVFLRPCTVLVIDDIEAADRIRARSLYHYGQRADVGADTFVITNGAAVLHGASVYPSVADNVIMGKDDRIITYHTERGPMARRNRYVYIENMHRAERVVFVTLLTFGKKPLPPVSAVLEGDPSSGQPFAVTLREAGRQQTVTCALATGTIECLDHSPGSAISSTRMR